MTGDIFTRDDVEYMSRAVQLARRGLLTTDPNPRVGCVIVNNDEVVAEGWHVRAGEGHAEVNALKAAGNKAKGGTAYVTLEPCSHFGRTPPCSQALLDAGVSRVVVAMQDPNPQVAGNGIGQLRQAGVQVETGLLEAQAERLNPGYLKRMREGRPWVRCKLAMSLDGRTAMASGESKWITGAAAREDVQRLRARSSAIMTGSGTVLADNPALTVRGELAGQREQYDMGQPLRVIIDSQLQTPPAAAILREPGQVRIYTLADVAENRMTALQQAGAEVVMLPARDSRVDLLAAMQDLADLQVNEVMVEAGAQLAGALLEAQLLDELVVYMAPKLMGDNARGLFHLPGLETMAQTIALEIEDVRKVGDDWRLNIRPCYGES